MTFLKIYKDRFNNYRFYLKPNNRITFFSEPYISKRKCLEKADFLRTHSRVDKNYQRLKAQCGSHYFVFKNHIDGEVIGTSESYLNVGAMEHSISLIKMGINKVKIDNEVYVM
ncbi:hypothetical protein EYD45_15995 [Hyunsoonleella flava]|uniref:DUF1508 domain-containing protein n=1 Tax=Hyunsoonleella flava TaxID=2527939 RepID=A0A4Q9FCN3_9FLAO|nr:YegP family protein [Hyunsoonleella flava]TBM99017.1 hypothetical protein EYD45_15995 [Hyunsoonleella flava]